MENEKEQKNIVEIEDFLRSIIEQLAPIRNDPVGKGRPRILPALCLWAGVIVCVLHGWNSQLGIWRLLNQKGLWNYPRFPITDQAIYKRLEKDGSKPFERLFEMVSIALRDRLKGYARPLVRFTDEIVAIDATSLDKVTRHLPLLRSVPNGDERLFPGKLSGVFDIVLQQWRYVTHIVNPTENDKKEVRSLLEHINKGALILADLGYFGFAWFDELSDKGYFWLSRLREKTSYEIIHTFYHQGETFDGLIWLGAYRADRAKHAVRLVTFRVGPNVFRYITNVIDPHQFSIHEIASIYARRWDIEMAFKLIKRELGLNLFWSSKVEVILQQVWAVLTIAKILHGIQMEIASKAGVDPFDVSLPLIVDYLPKWNDIDFIALIVEKGREGGFIRPSRRIRIKTPEIDMSEYVAPPPDLILERTPRYAGRRC
ncbi:MAG TPA: IS4 family transposase [Anaerolineaceae bacterium]|nr:IS4 family transposase [Anaerolineaceae bacterium]